MVQRLADGETLRLYYDGICIYSSGGSWLHPLFDLGDFLRSIHIDLTRTHLIDTITGKAAAFLVERLGIRSLHAGIMSELACVVLERAGIAYTADTIVPRIDCRTEELLLDVTDLGEACSMLGKRAGRAI